MRKVQWARAISIMARCNAIRRIEERFNMYEGQRNILAVFWAKEHLICIAEICSSS